MSEKIIELDSVSKIYKGAAGEVKALKKVTFSVKKGEFLAITGESGSGKSTLMNIIGCLDKQTEGMYYLKGEDVARLSSAKLARLRGRSIGFIFQDSNLIPTLNAVENVALPLYYRGISVSKRKAAALKALESVGMADRAYHLPSELSGGQRQRVAIARAVASEPDIILADEPTGALDSKRGQEITDILHSLSDNGVTVLMITHDNSLAQKAKRVLTVNNGRLTDSCFTSERIDSDGA